jgi:cell division inhibitor SulA
MSLENLLQRADIWRGDSTPSSLAPGLPTGFPELDRWLAGDGWPRGALTEILLPCHGIGELGLLLPALAPLSRGDRWLVFVAPPYIPYAPAFVAADVDLSRLLLVQPRARRDESWAVEQALRAGSAAVLAWLGRDQGNMLRRLQLAAEAGDAWGVVFRPLQYAPGPSPAALRLRLEPDTSGVRVWILKRRGGWPVGPINIQLNHALAGDPSAGARA